MVDADALIEIMKQEQQLLRQLAAICLTESKAIVQLNPALQQECLEKKNSLKDHLCQLEQQRLAVTGNRRLAELLPECEPDARGVLKRLQQELKAGIREVQAGAHTNKLLYQQSLALLSQIQKMTGSELQQLYNQAGTVDKNNFAGNLISNLA